MPARNIYAGKWQMRKMADAFLSFQSRRERNSARISYVLMPRALHEELIAAARFAEIRRRFQSENDASPLFTHFFCFDIVDAMLFRAA